MGKIRVGVIPAAGEGRRLGYLSSILPKCLFPVYDKPIIHYVVENMANIGVETIYLIVNYQKEKIKEYFKRVKHEIGVDISYVEQKPLLGIAHAIMLTKEFIDEPFVAILGDDCTITNSLSNLVDAFFEKNATVVEGVVKEEDENMLRSTCCVRLNSNKQIVEIIEKPKKIFSNIRGCGVYLFKSDVFEHIEKTPISSIRNEIEVTQTIDLIAKTGKAYGEFINGLNVNINSYEDLLRASISVKELKQKILHGQLQTYAYGR
jgi:glucose-1-phosphate thymidylyltransferase